MESTSTSENLTSSIHHPIHICNTSLDNTQGRHERCHTLARPRQLGSMLGYHRNWSIFKQLIQLCKQKPQQSNLTLSLHIKTRAPTSRKTKPQTFISCSTSQVNPIPTFGKPVDAPGEQALALESALQPRIEIPHHRAQNGSKP